MNKLPYCQTCHFALKPYLWQILLALYLLGAGVGCSAATPSTPQPLTENTLPVTPLWQVTLESEMRSIPQLTPDLVIVETMSRELYGLEAQTGEIRWHIANGFFPSPNPHSIVDDKLIYMADDHVIVADIATGETVWKYFAAPGEQDLMNMIVGDGLVYAIAYRRTIILALDLESGELQWRTDKNGDDLGLFGGKIFFLNQSLYFVDGPHVHVLNPTNGTIESRFEWPHSQWYFEIVDDKVYTAENIYEAQSLTLLTSLRSPTSRFLINGCTWFNPLYTFPQPQREPPVFYGTGKCGGTYAIDENTGQLVWSYRPEALAHSPVALYKDTLYVLFEDGELHALDPLTGQFVGGWQTNQSLPGFSSYADGLVANNQIMVAVFDDNQVWAFEAR